MSSHPNVILMAVLKPDGLSRKTMRGIIEESDVNSGGNILIASVRYFTLVMESDYNECYQVAADEGDLVFFDMITYGCGEWVSWDKLEAHKIALEEWAADICERYHCSCEIRVTANNR